MKDIFSRLSILCPGCGAESFPEIPGSFCPVCLQKLQFFDPRFHCSGCGGENDSAMEFCPQCLVEKPRLWQQAAAVFAYRSYGRELIRRFKFYNQPELARPLGILAAEQLENFIQPRPEVIVPVPLHLFRYLRRSYNQAMLLAQTVSTLSGIPVADIMHRKISFCKQSALNRSARHRGLQNAFSVKHPGKIAGKRVLLLDDILTTGMTLHTVAASLYAAGAAEVSILVIARVTSHTPFAFK